MLVAGVATLLLVFKPIFRAAVQDTPSLAVGSMDDASVSLEGCLGARWRIRGAIDWHLYERQGVRPRSSISFGKSFTFP